MLPPFGFSTGGGLTKEIAMHSINLPAGRFAAILADPPTEFHTYSAKGKGRSAEAHYDCMPHADICALSVARWAAPDCVLFLWAPRTLLPQTLEVIRAWDFQFKSIAFVWAKTIGEPNAQPSLLGPAAPRFWMGMGHWTRAGYELCLLATRGRPHRLNADVRELILAPRREHSRKPDAVYPLIERLVNGPYLELFASSEAPHRANWTRWVGKDRAPQRRWRSDSYPGEVRP
jgi:N6-adenosine-specific RNA methylase IME4